AIDKGFAPPYASLHRSQMLTPLRAMPTLAGQGSVLVIPRNGSLVCKFAVNLQLNSRHPILP
ncbi:MAG TPA: hypothetical protein VF020_22280, partial [Chthoniobacterales bacterium]